MSEIIGLNSVQNGPASWSIPLEGIVISRIHNNSDSIPPEEFDRTIATAARILSHCPNPSNRTPSRATVLALGRIQSGKTASYTALIGLAAQSGYKTIVVLAGTTNEILDQTIKRLRNDLGVYPQDMSSTIHLFTGNLDGNNRELIRAVIGRQGHIALFVVIKRNVHNIINLLEGLTTANNPTLIIDDEADQASLNTNFGRANQTEASFVNRHLNRLRDSLPVHGFIGYTATPQANILLARLDNLRPEHIELVEPGSTYCGGTVFFGSEQCNYVRIVPAEELESGSNAITPSLERALATFMVGAAIWHLRALRRNVPILPYSMLIHASQYREHHRDLSRAVRGLIDEWIADLLLRPTDPVFLDIEVKFKAAYSDFETTVVGIPAWENVFSRIRDNVIRYIDLRVVNASAQNTSPSEFPYQFENIILVGGEKLSRGLTIPGLAVAYMVRESNIFQADTLEQRARWFGYKEEYLDLCRIFLTETLSGIFHHLAESEDALWERLRRNQQQGLRFDRWKPMLQLNWPNLHATRPNVVAVRTFDPRGWNSEIKPSTNPEDAAYNINTVKNFLDNNPNESRSYGRVSHKVITSCSIERLIGLLTAVHYKSSDWDLDYYIEYLMRLREGGILSNVDVVFMNGGELRTRTALEDGTLPLGYLMQGHSDDIKRDDPRFYPGDENIHGGNAQFQIHILNYGYNHGQIIQTTAFALYIPEADPSFDLAYIVRADEYEP